jgi:hypothetical protein
MDEEPRYGGWVHPGGTAEEVEAHANRAIADYLSVPPGRCGDCSRPAVQAVFLRGRGASHYETGIAPVCDEHSLPGWFAGICAWVVDGVWVTEDPEGPEPTGKARR